MLKAILESIEITILHSIEWRNLQEIDVSNDVVLSDKVRLAAQGVKGSDVGSLDELNTFLDWSLTTVQAIMELTQLFTDKILRSKRYNLQKYVYRGIPQVERLAEKLAAKQYRLAKMHSIQINCVNFSPSIDDTNSTPFGTLFSPSSPTTSTMDRDDGLHAKTNMLSKLKSNVVTHYTSSFTDQHRNMLDTILLVSESDLNEVDDQCRTKKDQENYQSLSAMDPMVPFTNEQWGHNSDVEDSSEGDFFVETSQHTLDDNGWGLYEPELINSYFKT